MLDPIPSKLLKEVLPEVIDPLLAIINSSLSLGYVPKTFKFAVIKPLIKRIPKDLVNYRPISNLPFLSKILEKVASSQLYSFLEKNDICEDFQSGFRASHCTETALIRVKSSHLYLYSAFNITNCVKATAQYQNRKIVNHQCKMTRLNTHFLVKGISL